jgi:nucleotide-binding universal stress UspA family protein
MEKEDRILVPLDGSKCSESILPRVEELAKGSKMGVCLLRVVSARTFLSTDPIDVDVDTHVRYGDDVKEILDHASQKEIDLIAMSSHGRRGINWLIHGSVAEKVVQQTAKPVLMDRCASS